MNYELESKLRDKADNWRVDNLQSEIRSLKNEVDELRKTIGRNESRMSNQIYVIRQLVQVIIDNKLLTENESILYEIMNYSY